ncbi:hypothetical protein J6590_074168 [Homalodisca vitripennis]|nr:hypothetical protein J6590_074168 [Homalodisca vitripennis]
MGTRRHFIVTFITLQCQREVARDRAPVYWWLEEFSHLRRRSHLRLRMHQVMELKNITMMQLRHILQAALKTLDTCLFDSKAVWECKNALAELAMSTIRLGAEP